MKLDFRTTVPYFAKFSFIFILTLLLEHSVYGQCPMPANTRAGSLDTCFARGLSGNPFRGENLIYALENQPDGKVLVGGTFNTVDGVPKKKLCRLNADGNLDSSFTPDKNPFGAIYAIALQPNGKILAGGYYSMYYNGANQYGLWRYNSNGILDTTFPNGVGLNQSGTVYCLLQQSNGKTLVGGAFATFNNIPRNRLFRLNADGTLDTSFAENTVFNNYTVNGIGSIWSICMQGNNKFIVGGHFPGCNGLPRPGICRLNEDGSLDSSFSVNLGLDETIHVVTCQPDGKILVGGTFNSTNGQYPNRICRLNADGSLDNSFVIGTGFDDQVFALALQSDGKVIVGGWFRNYNGSRVSRICRLNSDGSLDTSFVTGTGFGGPYDNKVTVLSMQRDGKVLAGGGFTSYNGVRKDLLARLFTSSSPVAVEPYVLPQAKVYPNPAVGHILLPSAYPVRYRIYSTTGVVWQEGIAEPGMSIPVTDLPSGVYSLMTTESEKMRVQRFVKE